jgi:hypothetical protein
VVAAEAGAMIASWRGLVVAVVIALALGVVVIVDVSRTPAVVDRALMPGFDASRVTELVWERAGEMAIRVVRDGETWRLREATAGDGARNGGVGSGGAGSGGARNGGVGSGGAGSGGAGSGGAGSGGAGSGAGNGLAAGPPADPTAISDVLATLRGARWHRRGDATSARTTLTIVAGDARRVLGLGEPLPGTDQRWVVAGERSLLVDTWVARALDRDRLALRVKTPLADVARAKDIVIHREGDAGVELRLEGRPRQLVTRSQGRVVLAAELVGELTRALAEIAIVRLPDSPVRGQGVVVTAGGMAASAAIRVEIGGSCPGAPELVAISSTQGDGCIERTVATAVANAVERLAQPLRTLVERRPVPFEPARIVLPDGVTLEIKPLRLGSASAEPARVAELLAALAGPTDVAGRPVKPAQRQMTVSDDAGATITLDLFGERVLGRPGEPFSLQPADGMWKLLVRPSRELRDLALWLEEPTTIAAIRIDDVRYQRGAVIGVWTRSSPSPQPGPTVDAKALEGLVAALAAPRSLGFVDDAFAITHRVTLVVAPPAGADIERSIELGALRTAGCPARIGREAILLPASICTQVAALAR